MFGRQAAAGLRAWADVRGVALRIEDDRSLPGESARLAVALAPRCDLMFGPYGSGCGRAVAEAMAARAEVVWNHGAAAVPRTGARVVNVLGPAGRYWAGLPEVVGAQGAGRVAVVRAPGGFGEAVAAGAVAALVGAASRPVLARDLEPEGAREAVARAREAGAAWIAGGGRLEDDLALASAAADAGLAVALVACGVSAMAQALGARVVGWIGPAQWDGATPPAPFALPRGADSRRRRRSPGRSSPSALSPWRARPTRAPSGRRLWRCAPTP